MKRISLEIWLLGLAAIFFYATGLVQRPQPQPNLGYIAPPVELKYVTMGFSKQVSDTFWLRTIQDTEYCEKTIAEGVCIGKSWFFRLIDLVVQLDQDFSEAYYYGGLALTAVIHDNEGASSIFDRAVVRFKYEWPILYLAAYHALFEEKDKLKASRLYVRAADNGAPPWVRLSAGKLALGGGDKATAVEILQQLIKLESDPRWIKQLKAKLEEELKNAN